MTDDHEHLDRGEAGERRVVDGDRPEGEERAAEPGDAGGEREAVELRAGTLTPRAAAARSLPRTARSRRPARPRRRLATTRPRSGERGEHDEPVATRVAQGVDLDAEERRRVRPGAVEAAGERGVAEHHLADQHREAEGEHGEVDARACAAPGSATSAPSGHGGERTGEHRREERPAEGGRRGVRRPTRRTRRGPSGRGRAGRRSR